MADWIHCNKCFLRYQPKIKFYVTTCGHLKCKNCVSRIGPDKQCLVCTSTCDTTELSNHLKPDIQRFFRPYSELASNQSQIFSFQYSNAMSLLNKTTKKYTGIKGEIIKWYKATQEINKQNARLREMISSLAHQGGFKTSTSAPSVASAFTNTLPTATPIKNVPSRYGQFEKPATKFASRNQPSCTDGMHNQQRMSQRMPSSHSVPHGGPFSSENPAMISMSHLGVGSDKPYKV